MAYSAADIVDKLKARRDAIIDELAALTSSAAGGKPNSQQTGVDHVGYKRALYEELSMIDEQLGRKQTPIDVVVEATT